MSTPPVPSRLQFDQFVFDPTSGELSSTTETTRLQPQVAALLHLLLERAGTVVTRSEVRDRLWPDTTVEFDQGLNFCVRQLRLALGDDANQPRYIETLPRRGYRFLAHVARLGNGVAGSPVPDAEPTQGTTARSLPLRLPSARPPRARRLALLLGVTAAAGGALAIAATRDAGTPTPTIALAVMPFDMDGADSGLMTYRNRLAEDLVERTTRTGGDRMSVMGPTSTGRFNGMQTPLATLASDLGATHVLSGGVRRGTDGVQVFAQLIRVSDGRHLWAMRFRDSLAASLPDTSIAARITVGATTQLGR